jgi:hypothetical protein
MGAALSGAQAQQPISLGQSTASLSGWTSTVVTDFIYFNLGGTPSQFRLFRRGGWRLNTDLAAEQQLQRKEPFDMARC